MKVWQKHLSHIKLRNFALERNYNHFFCHKWNSTHYLIERYLKLRIYVCEIINNSADHRYKTLNLWNNDEIQIAESMFIVLAPFKLINKMLSYSKLSNSLILPCLIWLKKILESIPDDKEYLKSMKLFINDNFEKKWLSNRHLALSCILQKNFSLKSSFNFYKSKNLDLKFDLLQYCQRFWHVSVTLALPSRSHPVTAP